MKRLIVLFVFFLAVIFSSSLAFFEDFPEFYYAIYSLLLTLMVYLFSEKWIRLLIVKNINTAIRYGVFSLILFFSCSLMTVVGQICNVPMAFEINLSGHVIGFLGSMYIFCLIIGSILFLPLIIFQSRKDIEYAIAKEKDKKIQLSRELELQARLDMLQANLNPHFLFNTLNVLSELVYHDPVRSEKMILSLVELLRESLNNSNGYLIGLNDELALLNSYISIINVRFTNNDFNYTCHMEKGIEQAKVPRFILQPLIENAVKYRGANQVQIKLDIKKDGSMLNLSVYDNGIPFPENVNYGYGLLNVTEKFRLLYKNNYHMAFVNTPEKRISIKIPLTF